MTPIAKALAALASRETDNTRWLLLNGPIAKSLNEEAEKSLPSEEKSK